MVAIEVTGPQTQDEWLAPFEEMGRHRAAGTGAKVRSLDEFFAPLTTDQDWYSDEEKAIAQRYRDLFAVIKANLKNPTVVKVGTLMLTIYVVGSRAVES